MAKSTNKSAQLCIRLEPSLVAELRRVVAASRRVGPKVTEAAVVREALSLGLADLKALYARAR